MLVRLEETYPYLLRKRFKDAVFYQLSFGNIASEDLISQATAYLTHWRPQIIIVQCGLVDCRPEAFSQVEKAIIDRLPRRLFGFLKKNVNNPSLVKHRQVVRVSKESFRKTAKKFKMIFSSSKVFWLEISTAPGYEKERPGVGRKMAEYNAILQEIYGDGFVSLRSVVESNGYNLDHIHLTVGAHRLIADTLIQKMIGSPLEGVGTRVAEFARD